MSGSSSTSPGESCGSSLCVVKVSRASRSTFLLFYDTFLALGGTKQRSQATAVPSESRTSSSRASARVTNGARQKGSTGATQPAPCAAGSVANATGFGSCVPCAAGELQAEPGKNACVYCRRDLGTEVRIRCVVCPEPVEGVPASFCVECFGARVEIGEHKSSHDYQVVDTPSVCLLSEDWTADEELRLRLGGGCHRPGGRGRRTRRASSSPPRGAAEGTGVDLGRRALPEARVRGAVLVRRRLVLPYGDVAEDAAQSGVAHLKVAVGCVRPQPRSPSASRAVCASSAARSLRSGSTYSLRLRDCREHAQQV